jgi:hypothetical protein
VETALTGETSATSIYTNRTYEVADSDLPTILVTDPGDEAVEEQGASMGTIRAFALTLDITTHVLASTNADNEADDISAEIAAALFSDPTLGGLVKFLGLDSREKGNEDEAKQPHIWIKETWSCIYRVDMTDVTTILEW